MFIHTFLCSGFQMHSMHNSLLSSPFPVSPLQRFLPVSSASFSLGRDLFPTQSYLRFLWLYQALFPFLPLMSFIPCVTGKLSDESASSLTLG